MQDSQMNSWKTRIDPGQGYWADYFPLLQKLPDQHFPAPADLTALLKIDTRNSQGMPIRFVSSKTLPDEPYEQRIHNSGLVSTRAGNWHDLFNALVWARWPRIKKAMNALHQRGQADVKDGARGQQRDGLTLFDECGIIVASSRRDVLSALANHDWHSAFQTLESAWDEDISLFVTGHAMLEKCLEPYKAMTSNALLLQASESLMKQARNSLLENLDSLLAELMLAGEMLVKPSDLSALPLAGIPGWWQRGPQDAAFYEDQQVFRSPRPGFKPAPIFRMGKPA